MSYRKFNVFRSPPRLKIFLLVLCSPLLPLNTFAIDFADDVHTFRQMPTLQEQIHLERPRMKPVQENEIVNGKLSKIWGPGIRPQDIVLPARYFFVELIGPDGLKVKSTEEIRDDLKVRIDCNGERQVWTQVLDRKDGSFIVRYKSFQSCPVGFRIIVTFQSRHIDKSPYKINAPVHPDGCYCPRFEVSNWMKKAKCPTDFSQMDADLEPFHSVDFDDVLPQVVDRFYQPGAHSFCHYVIKDNQIYRKCYGQHVGFHIFPDAILTSLTRKMHFPDVEFIMNLGDWPLVNINKVKPLLPIFSWCKSNITADILLPTYELTEASLEGMGRVSLDMMTVQSNSDIQWDDKIPRLFWRGRDSRQERLDLILMGRKHSNLFNVSLTNFFFFRDQEAKYGPKEPHISFFKFFDYKYQLNIDGTVAAYRFPFLLGGDSVVFKVESPYVEHFYSDLKPWFHYIPIDSNLGDLVKKIKWAQDNDAEAQTIGLNGRQFAQEHLMPMDVLCYHAMLYKKWSGKLKNRVTVREDMELVQQPELVKPTVCECSPRSRYEAWDDKDEL